MNTHRYLVLYSEDETAVVGINEDGEVAAVQDHYVIFTLPRIAEVVAGKFRGQGWIVEVRSILGY